jgi:predicted Zn-dependent protease
LKNRRQPYFLLGFLVVFLGFVALCFGVSDSYVTVTGRVWPDSVATALPYYVNPTDVPSSIDYVSAVRAANQKWNDVSSSYFAFNYRGTTDVYFDSHTRDNMNSYVWNLTGSGMGEDALATNHYWVNSSTGQLVEFDVEVNGKFNFVYGSSPGSGEYNLLQVMMHESGHSLYLGHSSDRSAIMYFQYHNQNYLAQDDIDGITFLYPNGSPTPTVSPSESPTVSPTPTDTGSGDSGGGGGGGCFIATAAFGSYMHKDVMALRLFRDDVLMKSGPGRLFVETYYRTSPPIAAFIAGNPALRTFTRWALTPVVLWVKHPWAGFVVIFAMAILALSMRKRPGRGPGPISRIFVRELGK